MNKRLLNLTMRITALLATFSIIYPIVLAVRAALFGAEAFAVRLVFSSLLMLSGYVAASLIIGKSEQFLPKLFAFLAGIIPSFGVFLIYMNTGLLKSAYEFAAAFVFYFFGIRGYLLNYYSFLSVKKIRVGIVLFTALLVYSFYFQPHTYISVASMTSAFIFTILSMIVRNQVNLERNIFEKKDIAAANVTGKMRKYNTVIVLIIFGFILLLSNIREIERMLSAFVTTTLKAAVRGIFALILFLSQLFGTSGGGEDNAQPQQSGMPDMDPGKGNPVLDIVLYVIFGILLLFILYKLVPVAFRALKKLFASVAGLIGKLLHMIFKSEEGHDMAILESFNDEIEIIKPPKEDGENRKTNERKRRNRLSLKRTNDPALRTRMLYGNVVRTFAGRNIDIYMSDTTGEICRKSLQVEGSESFMSEMTGIYESVRYADKVPEAGEVARAELDYANLLELCKKNKK